MLSKDSDWSNHMKGKRLQAMNQGRFFYVTAVAQDGRVISDLGGLCMTVSCPIFSRDWRYWRGMNDPKKISTYSNIVLLIWSLPMFYPKSKLGMLMYTAQVQASPEVQESSQEAIVIQTPCQSQPDGQVLPNQSLVWSVCPPCANRCIKMFQWSSNIKHDLQC